MLDVSKIIQVYRNRSGASSIKRSCYYYQLF